MKQLLIFIETAFFSSVRELADHITGNGMTQFAEIQEGQFVDVARSTAGTALSDDSLRLIYRLYRDCWAVDSETGWHNVLNPIYIAAKSMLRFDGRCVRVRYDQLYHWRDFTRLLGEDVYITALLAHENRDSLKRFPEITPDLEYEPNLRNDDPQIESLLATGNLHDLHSHLKASAKIFDINWTCLMNHPAHREKEFSRLAGVHDHYSQKTRSAHLHNVVGNAAVLRFWMHRFLTGTATYADTQKAVYGFFNGYFLSRFSELERMIAAYRRCGAAHTPTDADYIGLPGSRSENRGDFAVYLGERYFLYRCWLYLMRNNNREFRAWFRYYIMCKSLLRQHMIQLNANHGFSNFQRYQGTKGLFVNRHPRYGNMLVSLAVADASRDSAVALQEVRIAPANKWNTHIRALRQTKRLIDGELDIQFSGTQHRRPSYSVIYHFIKTADSSHVRQTTPKGITAAQRNHAVRHSLKIQSKNIAMSTRKDNCIVGIDAASSEFNCRPEVFAQAYRFLRKFGLHATFHAGEDFYDLVDGMRAIDEAITFLAMQAGDRLGHALAMGINPAEYYNRCDNSIIIPSQWMLDNVVWLYCRSRAWNINMNPDIQHFLEKHFRRLLGEIYGNTDNIDIETYHMSMLLRGDDPSIYSDHSTAPEKQADAGSICGNEDWNRYARSEIRDAAVARRNNDAVRLYRLYHFDAGVRRRGDMVKEFKICPGYTDLIYAMQEKLMERIVRHDICIECCPSSNLLIGSLGSFEKHPIFRFYNVDPGKGRHMAVTVNTDDLGVFQTSLANEYSYLAMAMTRQTDSLGNRLYQPRQIMHWLREIAAFSSQYRFSR